MLPVSEKMSLGTEILRKVVLGNVAAPPVCLKGNLATSSAVEVRLRAPSSRDLRADRATNERRRRKHNFLLRNCLNFREMCALSRVLCDNEPFAWRLRLEAPFT